MKALVYWDRVLIKDIVNTALKIISRVTKKKRMERLRKCPKIAG
jgi:hypothetical protein